MRKFPGSLLILFLVAAQAWAQSPYEEGVHYFSLDQAAAGNPGQAVEVVEAFSYLCNHCNTFEPYIDSWQQHTPDGVVFKRVPVEFGRQTWGLYARAYVAASVMGIENKSHPVLMDTIWKQQKPMRNMEELAEFYTRFGVEKDKFLATARSFAVDMKMRREQQLVRTWGVTGTPTMIVNGKYRVNAGGAVGDFDTMLDVVDYLVARELAEQPAAEVPARAAETAAE